MESLNKEIRHLEELIQKKDIFKARRLADHLKKRFPGEKCLILPVARIHLMSGKVAEAMHLAQTASMKLNFNIEALSLLGYCHQRLGEHSKAAETYEQIIAKAPKSTFAYFQLGETLKECGKHDEAIDAYNKSADLDKDGDIRMMAEEKIIQIKEDLIQD